MGVILHQNQFQREQHTLLKTLLYNLNCIQQKNISNNIPKKFSNIFQKSDWIQSDNSISPDMKPSEALKKDNRNSSMSNAISDLKGNDNEITISAGNTGAMMAYATVYLRTIENISAIASLFPSKNHPVCFLDLGANSECQQIIY